MSRSRFCSNIRILADANNRSYEKNRIWLRVDYYDESNRTNYNVLFRNYRQVHFCAMKSGTSHSKSIWNLSTEVNSGTSLVAYLLNPFLVYQVKQVFSGLVVKIITFYNIRLIYQNNFCPIFYCTEPVHVD